MTYEKIKKLTAVIRNTSILKTLRLNYRYFGVRGGIKPIILVSKHVKINCMQGKIIVHNRSAGAVRIGYGHTGIIDECFERGIFENCGTIEFMGRANIGTGSRIVCMENGYLVFGENVSFNAKTSVICRKKISIGKDSLVSWDCLIMDTDFHVLTKRNTDRQLNEDKEIIIGEHVWIGCRSTILKGAVIPDHAVTAAGSTVSKELESRYSVYAGNIRKKDDINWMN